MAILIRLGLASVAIVAGCYSPELRDCVVSCATAADCAPDQVCGEDNVCAAPELAGRCAGRTVPTDAPGPMTIDAPRLVDAAPPIDASLQRILRIDISGRGGVTIAGVGTCHYSAMLPCTAVVVAGVPTLLEAEPDRDARFDKWESGPCMGQDETCTFVPTLPITDVKAKFRQDN